MVSCRPAWLWFCQALKDCAEAVGADDNGVISFSVHSLSNVFVLIDVRHEQQKIDREFVDWLGQSGIPFSIIFTKADKLGPVKARQDAEAWMHQLEDGWGGAATIFHHIEREDHDRDEVLDYIEKFL